MKKNVETFIGCDSEYEESGIVLFGAPFDSTTSFRPGARFGSAAIRHESFGIETYSPYQDKDLTDIKVFDCGDLELSFGLPETALKDIEDQSRKILSDGKLPILIGGEHLVTLGSVKAVFEKHPDLQIIHFDAHCDLRDDYLGANLSHATSSASGAVTVRSSFSQKTIRICISSVSTACRKYAMSLRRIIHRSILRSILTVWIRPSSAEREHLKQVA